MEDTLQKLGFNPKEVKFYQLLLQEGRQTAAQLAELSGESRTNSYMILDGMIEKGVVASDDRAKTREFWTTEPSNLSKLLQAQQERQKQAVASLNAAMPQLKSQYALAHNRPGVIYMAGLEGFKTMLEDMNRSKTEVLLIASDAPTERETWDVLVENLMKRKQQKIKTRAIYHTDDSGTGLKEKFKERGMELRFLGKKEFNAEMAVYEDNVIFTAYEPTLVNTILTNQNIADTMRTLFEELWQKAK